MRSRKFHSFTTQFYKGNVIALFFQEFKGKFMEAPMLKQFMFIVNSGKFILGAINGFAVKVLFFEPVSHKSVRIIKSTKFMTGHPAVNINQLS